MIRLPMLGVTPVSACLTLMLLSAFGPARAAEDKIAELSAQIAKEPSNPALFILRAKIHSARGDHESALADLELAASLPGGGVTANVAAGETLFQLGRHAAALEKIDLALAREPGNVQALRTRGHLLLALGRPAEAARVRRQLLAATASPQPDDYVELAEALAASGTRGKREALVVLDQGVARLGAIVSLEIPALELEVKLRRWSQALRRVDVLAAATPRKDIWLQRRAEILRLAGRRKDAQQAQLAAQRARKQLPGPPAR